MRNACPALSLSLAARLTVGLRLAWQVSKDGYGRCALRPISSQALLRAEHAERAPRGCFRMGFQHDTRSLLTQRVRRHFHVVDVCRARLEAAR